jgi:type I restriction enzyme S subunit
MTTGRASTLNQFLEFRNGKTSPDRTGEGAYAVFGSNGEIGRSDSTNATGPLVVIGRVGSYCGSLFYSEADAWVTDNAIVCSSKDSKDVRYWYYAMQTLDLNGRSSGSGQPLLNQSVLGAIAFDPPEMDARQAIAEVLGALDDKIAANIKLAASADEMLATRFKSSVGGKTTMVQLNEIADVNRSTVKPSHGDQLRYVDIASVGVGSYTFPPATAWDDAPSRARRAIHKGDTLWSTVRPNRRSHALNLSDDPLLVGSTGLAVLTARTVGWAYLYEVTRRPEFTTYLETVAEGSAYPAVRADRFGDALVPLADEASRRSFEQLAEPLREELHLLDQENRTLATIRDALLPQLMSGKLQVKDADKVLEKAGV